MVDSVPTQVLQVYPFQNVMEVLLFYSGYQISLLGVHQLGCGIDSPPLSSASIKERVELYLYFTFMACSRMNCTPITVW
jgi:hypothetical protein